MKLSQFKFNLAKEQVALYPSIGFPSASFLNISI